MNHDPEEGCLALAIKQESLVMLQHLLRLGYSLESAAEIARRLNKEPILRWIESAQLRPALPES